MLGVTGNVQTWLVISGIFDFQPYDHILIDPQFSKHIFHMKPPIRHKYIDQPLYPHLPLWSFFFITVISHEILIPHEKNPWKKYKKIPSPMEIPKVPPSRQGWTTPSASSPWSGNDPWNSSVHRWTPREKRENDLENWKWLELFLENNDPERMFEIVFELLFDDLRCVWFLDFWEDQPKVKHFCFYPI